MTSLDKMTPFARKTLEDSARSRGISVADYLADGEFWHHQEIAEEYEAVARPLSVGAWFVFYDSPQRIYNVWEKTEEGKRDRKISADFKDHETAERIAAGPKLLAELMESLSECLHAIKIILRKDGSDDGFDFLDFMRGAAKVAEERIETSERQRGE